MTQQLEDSPSSTRNLQVQVQYVLSKVSEASFLGLFPCLLTLSTHSDPNLPESKLESDFVVSNTLTRPSL